MKPQLLALPLSVILFVVGCNYVACNDSELKDEKAIAKEKPFVQAPLPAHNIPYRDYSVDAEKGDTLFYKSGSIIVVPSNAFLDKAGNIIKGKVQVKYREFSNPMDFFISGIPMNYDSAGVKYNFESSGMCEILAFKDDAPVFVNPKSKPVINLLSGNNSLSHNLYYLDTVQKKWTYREISVPMEVGRSKTRNTDKQFANEVLEQPIKPIKANDKTPVIQIEVDPGSFQELQAYNNMLFQIDPNEKDFNEADSVNEWNTVKLNRTKQHGVYSVSFSNANETVSYLARPVFEGENYEKALKIFEQKRKEYDRQLSRAIAKDKKNREQYILDSLEDIKETARIEKINKANRDKYTKDSVAFQKVLEENEKIAKRNEEILARNAERARRRAIIEEENRQMDSLFRRMLAEEERRPTSEYNQANAIYRSFQVDGFGIWNCDRPIETNAFPIAAEFADSTGKHIDVGFITVAYSGLNGIMRFNDNNIQLARNSRNMIWGIYEGKLAFASYNYYDDPKKDMSSAKVKFEMSLIPVSEENYKYLRDLVNQPSRPRS